MSKPGRVFQNDLRAGDRVLCRVRRMVGSAAENILDFVLNWIGPDCRKGLVTGRARGNGSNRIPAYKVVPCTGRILQRNIVAELRVGSRVTRIVASAAKDVVDIIRSRRIDKCNHIVGVVQRNRPGACRKQRIAADIRRGNGYGISNIELRILRRIVVGLQFVA
ncbi:hypothetical protein SDC9_82351 [bioreactor metagenome]|uniref:Uncharacterized protein n=1 Tax=bioreactor metagenome TaxID=1076179 RepID=A0A644Z574_9ZZZZ